MMFTNSDFKLGNIAVITQDNKLLYKVLDPDSWEMLPLVIMSVQSTRLPTGVYYTNL